MLTEECFCKFKWDFLKAVFLKYFMNHNKLGVTQIAKSLKKYLLHLWHLTMGDNEHVFVELSKFKPQYKSIWVTSCCVEANASCWDLLALNMAELCNYSAWTNCAVTFQLPMICRNGFIVEGLFPEVWKQNQIEEPTIKLKSQQFFKCISCLIPTWKINTC